MKRKGQAAEPGLHGKAGTMSIIKGERPEAVKPIPVTVGKK